MNYRFFLTIIILLTLSVFNSNPQASCNWPSFHGPERTNKSTETGLLKKWPAGGPRLLFTLSGLGEGYSSVSFGEGLIFTAGTYNRQSTLFAFDMNGKVAWRSSNGQEWSPSSIYASSYTGPRSTPTYDGGRVYYLSEGGRLAVYEAKTGREIWAKDLVKDFAAPETLYGYSESVYIDGNKIYVRPIGKKGFQVCLNKNDGSLIWANTEIPGDAGYSSPVVFEFGGYKHLIGSSATCYYGVDASTGRLLWRVDFENQHEVNVNDPIVKDGFVFLTSGYGKGSILYKLNPSGNRFAPQMVWQSKLMDNELGSVILHEGFLYGAGDESRGWFCLDLLTGKQMWNSLRGKGPITYADGLLYLLDERSGAVSLVKATPDRFELLSEFNVPSGGKGPYWAHPVVCGKRLYVRHWDKVFVYSIG